MNFGEHSTSWCLLPHAMSFVVEGIWVHTLTFLSVCVPGWLMSVLRDVSGGEDVLHEVHLCEPPCLCRCPSDIGEAPHTGSFWAPEGDLT